MPRINTALRRFSRMQMPTYNVLQVASGSRCIAKKLLPLNRRRAAGIPTPTRRAKTYGLLCLGVATVAVEAMTWDGLRFNSTSHAARVVHSRLVEPDQAAQRSADKMKFNLNHEVWRTHGPC